MLAKLKRWILNLPDPVEPAFKKGYRSRFGGFWIDRDDWESTLRRKQMKGEIDTEMAELLTFWRQNGYVILPGAVPVEVIDQLMNDINQAWEQKDSRLQVQLGHGQYVPLAEADRNQVLLKLLDMYVYSEAARKAAFSPSIRNFLHTIFERDILCFQNLTFEKGSTQAVHQDTAYVVTSSPLEFAASWIALEDIAEGSGELVYYPGSHQFKENIFGGQFKHWEPSRDGKEAHDIFLQNLHAQAKERGLTLQKFRPKKGDALIWSADLAHGGGEIKDPNLSRRSFVSHYCPVDLTPHYFRFHEDKAKKVKIAEGGYISSMFYNIPG